MTKTHYGSPKTYPYFVKFNDGRTSGVFKTKKAAKELMESSLGGKGKIIDRRN